MVPVEQHRAACLALARPLPPVEVALLDALGAVLAQDVVAGTDLPAFANSSMDGYAVHAEDVAGASPDAPVRLPVVGDLPAGARERLALPRGAAIRIMTGAPVPEGDGAVPGVVPVEQTDRGTEVVELRAPTEPGRFVRPVGDDVRAGTVVLAAGTPVGPRQVGLCAAVGLARLRVHRRPVVAVLSTGDELVEPGAPVGFGQLSDANGYALTAAVREAGAEGLRLPLVRDDADALAAALEDAAARADVVLTSGGVSAGAYDTVKEVLSALGTVRFDRVAMQPGMPQGAGTLRDGTPVLTLPGNPVSSYVSFEVFVRPVLRRAAGARDLHRPTAVARAVGGWSSPPGKRQFVRAALARDAGGLRVEPVGGPGSHLLADLARADCLAVVPEDVTAVADGDEVTCMLLDGGPG